MLSTCRFQAQKNHIQNDLVSFSLTTAKGVGNRENADIHQAILQQ